MDGLATPLVGAHRETVMGRRFYKMSGSGNDFVVFDARSEPVSGLDEPTAIRMLCARGTGVGADGVVFIEPPTAPGATLRMRYYNADGSRAQMCGNAALCVTRLASELGAATDGALRLETDSGVLGARMAGPLPEVELAPVEEVHPTAQGIELAPGERRIGYCVSGVPHLVVLRDEVEGVDVVGRGRTLRTHAAVRPHGANVNFVARRADGGWTIRTYERGVEGETLACGTGAIASAILLNVWGLSADETPLLTRSGRVLTVKLERSGGAWRPTIRGEGRLVFAGELLECVQEGSVG